ncbi:hypothetical protein ACMFMF_007178 [Clarireedia jacksonii]
MGDFLRVPDSHGRKKPGEGSVAVNSSISNSTKAEDRYFEGLERNEEARRLKKLKDKGLRRTRELETISEGGSSYTSRQPSVATSVSKSRHSQIPSDSGVSTTSKRSIKATDRNALVPYEGDGSDRSHISKRSVTRDFTPSLVGSRHDRPLLDDRGNPGVRHVPAFEVHPPSDDESNTYPYTPSKVSSRLSDASRTKSHVSSRSEARSKVSSRLSDASRTKSHVSSLSEAPSKVSSRLSDASRTKSHVSSLSEAPSKVSSRLSDASRTKSHVSSRNSYAPSVRSQRSHGGGSAVTSSTALPPSVEINNIVVNRTHGSRKLARSGSENEMMVMESFTMHSKSSHRRVRRDGERGVYYDD